MSINPYIANHTSSPFWAKVQIEIHNASDSTLAYPPFEGRPNEVPPFSNKSFSIHTSDPYEPFVPKFELKNLSPGVYYLVATLYGRTDEGSNYEVYDRNKLFFKVDATPNLYETDFSKDPGWTTNNGSRFYWDSLVQAYYANTVEGANEYSTIPLNWNGDSFRLEFDIKIVSSQWASGISVGLFDEDRNYSLPSVVDVIYGNSDAGLHVGLHAADGVVSKGAPSGVQSVQTGVWYRNVVTWDKSTGVMGLLLTKRDTGEMVGTYSIEGLTSFPTSMNNLGVSWVGHNASSNATVSYLDNVKFYGGVLPGNNPPLADNQTVTTNKNTGKAITLTATDPDGDALTYVVVTQPAHGTVSVTGSTATYTPATGYTGSDSFTFKANDGKVDSNVATISITVQAVNNPPSANNQTVTTNRNTGKAITLTATDADGDALTYVIVTQPGHGTLSGTPPNVTYTPVAGYVGSDSFTFKANDGKVDSNVGTISITVQGVNNPPSANNQTVTTNKNAAKAIILTGADPDGDALTYVIVTQPAHGTISGTPPNLTYAPATGYIGSDSFTFKANDEKVDSNVATVSITVQAVNNPSLAVADFNGDGKADIIWHNPMTGNIYAWFMSDAGKLKAIQYIKTVNDFNWKIVGFGDFDRDGNPDILWWNKLTGAIYIWYMNGATYLYDQHVRTVSDTNWKIVGVGDFNGDGYPDILWQNQATGAVYVWYMNGANLLYDPHIRTVSDTNWKIVGVADCDGDGHADIYWQNRATGAVYVWYMNGATFLYDQHIRTVPDLNWEIIGVDDYNGDGSPDLLWKNQVSGQVYLWNMDGALYLHDDPVQTCLGSTAPCDFDCDGNGDILWQNQATGQVYVWYMDGAGFMGDQLIRTIPDTNWKIEAVADFNGDGHPDILWRHQGAGWVYVWYMNGATFTADQYVRTVGDTNWKIVGAADFDGDGHTDILWQNQATGAVYVWYMDGAAFRFDQHIRTVSDTNWKIVGAGDFDKDGKPDIFWQNQATGAVYVWYMNGATFRSDQHIRTVSDTNWKIEGVVDFNKDGSPDILWRNQATGDVYVWYMNGATFMGDQFIRRLGDTNWKIVN